MNALLSELVSYLIKFFAMIICMLAGIMVGKKLRKNKDEKIAAEKTEE